MLRSILAEVAVVAVSTIAVASVHAAHTADWSDEGDELESEASTEVLELQPAEASEVHVGVHVEAVWESPCLAPVSLRRMFRIGGCSGDGNLSVGRKAMVRHAVVFAFPLVLSNEKAVVDFAVEFRSAAVFRAALSSGDWDVSVVVDDDVSSTVRHALPGLSPVLVEAHGLADSLSSAFILGGSSSEEVGDRGGTGSAFRLRELRVPVAVLPMELPRVGVVVSPLVVLDFEASLA